VTLRPQILPLAALIALLALAGCGNSNEPEGERLPPETVQALLQQLDSVSDRVAANVSGACNDIYDSADNGGNFEPIDDALASLPDDVDSEIRAALEESIDRLKQLVDDECTAISDAELDETTPEETAPVETTTEETTPEQTDTETVPEETAPEEQQDEPPADSQPPGRGPDGNGPPGQDGDGDNGGGIEAPAD
jgi:hypothetical protein